MQERSSVLRATLRMAEQVPTYTENERLASLLQYLRLFYPVEWAE